LKIKPRNEVLNDIISDAKKHPKGWKAIYGRDETKLSRDYYVLNPNIGIYLIKEFEKNPYLTKGLGGKITRKVDDDIVEKMTNFKAEFGILQGDILKITQNIKKGITPRKIFDEAFKEKGKNLGLTLPMRGNSTTSSDSFTELHQILSKKQNKIDEKFGKLAYDEGLYSSYD